MVMTDDVRAEFSLDDRAHMRCALALAARGLNTTDPNPRVGCVLVRGGEIVGEGWHERAGEPHAEVLALRAAGARARGAVAYVTLEPCSHTGRTPPCADALAAAGVAGVACATIDPNPQVAGGGRARLEGAGIAVAVGLCAMEARELNGGYFSRFERGRPLVRLKLAMSLDGRTAPADGGRSWITDEASRADVQVWRARSSAILTGAGTVRSDDPQLNVRWSYGPWVRQPLRVVLDPNLSVERTARIFDDGNAIVFAAGTAQAPAGADAARAGAPRIERVPRVAHGVNLGAVLARLAALEVNELWVECGPRLAAEFFESGLIDELILYIAPSLLGADAPPLAALTGLDRAAPLPQFQIREHRMIDGDLRLVLVPKHRV